MKFGHFDKTVYRKCPMALKPFTYSGSLTKQKSNPPECFKKCQISSGCAKKESQHTVNGERKIK